MQKIAKKDLHKYGRPRRCYPVWRWPLLAPSYHIARFLVNHGFKNPNILSNSMIVIGFCGAILLFFNEYYTRVLGASLIIISYFFDLMDGKTARMLNKDASIGKFIDRNYHVPITAIALFGIGFHLYNTSSNFLFGINFTRYGLDLPLIYLLLGFFASWFFTMKYLMHSSYIHFLRDIQIKKGEKIEPFLPADMNKHQTQFINEFTSNKKLKYAYLYFFRLFIDSTDIWFLIFITVLLTPIINLESYILIMMFFIYIPLFFVNYVRKYKILQKKGMGI